MPTITYKNNDDLRDFLKRGGLLKYLDVPSFDFDSDKLSQFTQEVLRQRGHYSEERAGARAAYRLLSLSTTEKSPVIAQGKTRWVRTLKTAWNISRDGSKPPVFTTSRVWHWFKIIWAILLLAGVATIAFEGRAHAQGNANGTGNAGNALQGISLQFQNAGTPIGTRAAGRVNVNCGTNVSCSFVGNTFTITSTGGAGSGCTPPGTSGALLYDATAGACNDVTKFTSNGTTTITGLATSIFDLSAGATFKPPQITAPTAEGTSAFNTTSHLPVWGFNGASTTTIPKTLTNVSHKWLNSYDQTTGTLTQTQPDYSDLTGVPSTFAPTAHNLLSASHGDTTAASPTRGDGIFSIGAGATWQRLAHPAVSGGYFKWNGSDIVASTLAASGTGTPTACSNQVVTGFTLNADAAPTSTCATITSSFTSGTFTATAHNLLSAIHGDTTAAAVLRGAIITGQGASPAWTLLAHGTQYQVLNGGANEPLWDALHLDQATAVTGTLPNGNLVGSGATTVNSQSCALGGSCTIPFQTNTVNNTSQAGINLLTSTANAVGLTITPTNSATNQLKFEITGANYTGNAGTASALFADPSDCTTPNFARGINAAGTAQCAQPAYSEISGTPTLFYQTVQNAAGTGQTQQPIIQFTGTAVTSVVNDGANTRTVVTLTAGAGGTGCTPGGTPANGVLYDTGSGMCDDISKLTWNSGTSTLSGLSGGIFDFSASTMFKQRVASSLTTSANGDLGYDTTTPAWHAYHNGQDRLLIVSTNVGTAGQAFLSNNDGSGVFADPIVSGPDAVGVAATKNPVQIGGVDNFGNAQRALFLNKATTGAEMGLVVRDTDDNLQLQQLTGILTAVAGQRIRGVFGRPINSSGDALDVNTRYGDPCASPYVRSIPISQTTNTLVISNEGGGWFCGGLVIGADSENVSYVRGSGTTCGTGTAAIIGGATAAAGPNMVAGGGFSFTFRVPFPAGDVCLFQSGSGRVAGVLTYILNSYVR